MPTPLPPPPLLLPLLPLLDPLLVATGPRPANTTLMVIADVASSRCFGRYAVPSMTATFANDVFTARPNSALTTKYHHHQQQRQQRQRHGQLYHAHWYRRITTTTITTIITIMVIIIITTTTTTPLHHHHRTGRCQLVRHKQRHGLVVQRPATPRQEVLREWVGLAVAQTQPMPRPEVPGRQGRHDKQAKHTPHKPPPTQKKSLAPMHLSHNVARLLARFVSKLRFGDCGIMHEC
jgi:hypothetical protein